MSKQETSTAKHTPGPWDWFIGTPGNKEPSREPQMRNLIGSNGQGFAHTVGLYKEEDEANAHLIAAAPQLLEALKDAMEAIKVFHGKPAWEIYERSAPEYQRMKAAIKAAEGQQ